LYRHFFGRIGRDVYRGEGNGHKVGMLHHEKLIKEFRASIGGEEEIASFCEIFIDYTNFSKFCA